VPGLPVTTATAVKTLMEKVGGQWGIIGHLPRKAPILSNHIHPPPLQSSERLLAVIFGSGPGQAVASHMLVKSHTSCLFNKVGTSPCNAPSTRAQGLSSRGVVGKGSYRT
jgi:hypothetical protein